MHCAEKLSACLSLSLADSALYARVFQQPVTDRRCSWVLEDYEYLYILNTFVDIGFNVGNTVICFYELMIIVIHAGSS